MYTHTLPSDYQNFIFPKIDIQESTYQTATPIRKESWDGESMHFYYKYGYWPYVYPKEDHLRLFTYVRKLHTDGFYYLCPHLDCWSGKNLTYLLRNQLINRFLTNVYMFQLLGTIITNHERELFIKDPNQIVETARIQL
jgi:hypothetical protein